MSGAAGGVPRQLHLVQGESALGDKGPESTVGPAFKSEDVSVSDLNLTGAKNGDSVGEGDRFHFVARVVKYNPTQCLLFLAPVSTSVR